MEEVSSLDENKRRIRLEPQTGAWHLLKVKEKLIVGPKKLTRTFKKTIFQVSLASMSFIILLQKNEKAYFIDTPGSLEVQIGTINCRT